MTRVEICLEDIDGVPLAEQSGADRIELCADLAQGGITPSIGTVACALSTVRTMAIHVLIRQRPGDFVYSEAEVAAMLEDIRVIRALSNPAGVSLGFVIGALSPNVQIDVSTTRRLVEACAGAPVTFHKAFDEVADQYDALETLVELGVTRILTSGGATTATAGATDLAQLVKRSAGRIGILAAGGIRPGNAHDLVMQTDVTEIHLRAPDAGAEAVGRNITSGTIVERVLTEIGRPRA